MQSVNAVQESNRCFFAHPYKTQFLGAFAKFRKATINIIMSVRPSFCLYGATRLPLDGFSRNFILEHFSKNCPVNSSFIKIG